ncbi:MAG: diaminopropionate ammonia-lyase [Candidatus Cloacimonetes bacterium]|nr:diaminopropionate ammonia-lyase [Candidatus Cloacimonadota bacterium]
MNPNNAPIKWLKNKYSGKYENDKDIFKIIPKDISRLTRSFHRQIPEYNVTPLINLTNLASMLNIGGIWVKDESVRLNLNSFKVLGGSFAIYRFLKKKLNMDHLEIPLAELNSSKFKKMIGNITFATATDGNHGRGVAWAAKKLGYKSVIYVHKGTSKERIEAIKSYGATVKIINGTYDAAVRQVNIDAEKNEWQVISDTSWVGYEEIPTWIMQGYTTMLSETQEQLVAQGIIKPTHIFVQAGVGALAASVIGYYHALFGKEAPISVVIEPSKAACIFDSLEKDDDKLHTFKGELNTIMAGLACGEASPIAWKMLKNCADFFIASPDYVAAKGMRIYSVPIKGDPVIISGESGAVTLAVLMYILESEELLEFKKDLNIDSSSQILLINTEGNTDPINFRRIVWEGSDSVPKQYWTE